VTSRTVPLVVHVVIPAHDEAELIDPCLTAVGVAAARLLEVTGVRATVTVVADACTDSTVEVARGHEVDLLEIDVRGVGPARDAGVRHALAATAPLDASRVWVAMTDADSVVPTDWLEAQFRSASKGFDLLIGPVHPDPAGLSPAVVREWWVRHQRPDQLHVHGANLGFTAATFLGAGGFPAVTEHEDVAFVQAALDSGSTWTMSGPAVRTSGRVVGRTPGGFAHYLRLLVAELDQA
jgi:glycosyltransferase involved in cell wall biosynthesis